MAGGGRVFSSSGAASFLLRNQRGSSASEPLDSLFLSGSSNASSTSPFLGTSSVLFSLLWLLCFVFLDHFGFD